MNWEIYLLSISDNIQCVTRAAAVVTLYSILLLYIRTKELTAVEEKQTLGEYLEEISRAKGWYDARIEKLSASVRFFKWLLLIGVVIFVASLFVPTVSGINEAADAMAPYCFDEELRNCP